jgi:phosphoglycolate phosphatase
MDIDNTVFDWVHYYVNCLGEMLNAVSEITGTDKKILAAECKDIFTKENSIEYPFVVQQMPSVVSYYAGDYRKLIDEAVAKARDSFLDKAQSHLVAYEGVLETMKSIKEAYPELKIAALTDAPRYVAMWKLNKLGLLGFFDSIYGLGDPRIPVSNDRKTVLVSEEILIKHLEGSQFEFSGAVRILPDEYEKPGKRGLKTILMDYDLDENLSDRELVLWVGDNVKKDVGLGNSMGITTVWAKYGTGLPSDLMDELKTFSPEINVSKNVSVSTELEGFTPKYTLEKFSDLFEVL